MSAESRNGEPVELVYVPESSWQPALIAFGLAAVLASLFTWWPYGVVGGDRRAVRAARLDPRRAP